MPQRRKLTPIHSGELLYDELQEIGSKYSSGRARGFMVTRPSKGPDRNQSLQKPSTTTSTCTSTITIFSVDVDVGVHMRVDDFLESSKKGGKAHF